MKVICSQNDFKNHLTSVSRVVPSRPTHPILGNVLLVADAEKQTLTLTAFDLTLGMCTYFPAEVEQPGSITLPAKLLSDIVSRLPLGEITLVYEEDDLVDNPQFTLTSASGHFQIRAMSATEYPELPLVGGDVLSLPIGALLEGLKSSIFAASTEEAKQILTGVHLHKEGDLLEFAATDGHRLAVGVQELSEDSALAASGELAMTIPVRAFRELERMLGSKEAEQTVKFSYDDTQVAFEFGEQKLTTRKLDGSYPTYRKLIPQSFTRQVMVEKKSLLRSLEIMAIFADQRNNLVKFSLKGSSDELCLEADGASGGGLESVPATITGEDLAIGLNVKYLMDGLKSFTGNQVQIQLNEANQPVIFTPLGGSKITYLVMPVQLRD